ncbi:GNAT family N-acetyltransferase [Brachybacterium hainanense]|uniref:GNAT family N-acetyltransferase n=1 Tax=Brachybacterium hainanense TaxID=1541174 RepID=A0ABV6RF84_9MICO
MPTREMAPPRARILEGPRVRLEPLRPDHAAGLAEAVRDGELWTTPFTTHIPRPEQAEESVAAMIAKAEAGEVLAWAVVLCGEGGPGQDRVVGQTTFLNIAPADRRVEIGSTYMAASTHGRGVNAHVKQLLLTEAFEELGCLRVELRTHHLNHVSRRAIERLGAVQEGMLRNHRIMPDGTLRHTVVYAILAEEWPAVRTLLAHRTGRGAPPVR